MQRAELKEQEEAADVLFCGPSRNLSLKGMEEFSHARSHHHNEHTMNNFGCAGGIPTANHVEDLAVSLVQTFRSSRWGRELHLPLWFNCGSKVSECGRVTVGNK